MVANKCVIWLLIYDKPKFNNEIVFLI